MSFMQRCLAAVLVLVAAGCGQQPAEDVLRRGNGGDPGTLNPSLAEDVHAFEVLADLYEGLVVPGPGGAIRPGVAESWTIGDAGVTYTFNLHERARWSNGEPVVAEDFVRRFRDVAAPESTSPLGFLLTPIQHFDAVRAAEIPPESLGIVAVDERTLKLTLSEPAPQLLSILSLPIAYPMHAAASGEAISPLATPTNGAYRLVDWQPGDVIRLTRSPEYRDASTVSINKVEYYPIADPTAELNRYRAGELDMTHSVPPALVERLRLEYENELRIAPRLALYYVAFDLTEAPLDRRALRKALSLAVDRDAIVRMLGRGERPAYGLVPPGIAGYATSQYEWHTTERRELNRIAQTTLREAFGDSSELPAVKLVYDDGDVHERIALAVAGMWRDVLKLPVELEKREWKRFLATRERRDEWDAMRFSWFGDYPDPSTFTDLFLSDSEQNLPGYRNPAYDTLLERAANAPADERLTLIAAAERQLLDDYPIVPLYFYVSKHLVSPRLRGFEHNALDRHPSRYLSFADE